MPDQTNQVKTILLAEPDDQLRQVLQLYLHAAAYETKQAISLEEAFTAVDEHPVDLVLMDSFALPNQPRLAAASRFKRYCAPTPVGILTGWPIAPDEAEQAGFAFLVQKPFSFELLLERIAVLLNQPFTPELQQHAQVIRRSLEALSAGDWDSLRALCTPTVRYYPLTRSAFTPERAFIGIEAYLAYAHLVRQRLPGFRIEQVVIFQSPKGLIARYSFSWQGSDGQRQHLASSAMCRFRGERLSQIGVSQPTQRLRALLGPPQEQADL